MPLPVRPPGDSSGNSAPRVPQQRAELPNDDSLALPEIDFSSFGAGEREQEKMPEIQKTDSFEEFDYSEEEEGLPDLSASVLPALPEIENEELPKVPVSTLSEDELDDLFDEIEETAPEAEESDDWATFDEGSISDSAPVTPDDSIDDLFDDDEEYSSEDSDEDDWDSFDDEEQDEPKPTEAIDDALLAELFSDDDEEEQLQETEPLEPQPTEALPTETLDDFDSLLEDLDQEEPEQSEEEYTSTFDENPEDEDIPEEEALKPLKKEKKKPKRGKGRGEKSPNSLLKKLASIPVLGLLFKPLQKLGSLGLVILGLVPLLAIALIIYFIAAGTVPSGNSASGPDGAQASISDFSYEDGTVKGVVTNEGEIIANVTTTFTIWTYNPFGGGSIFAFDKVATCEAEEISVDIDAKGVASAPCEIPSSGLFTKQSGTISF